MRKTRNISLLLLLTFSLADRAVYAQDDRKPASQGRERLSAGVNSSNSQPGMPPTAEEVLEALRKRRPQNPVIEPASALNRVGQPKAREPLYPEGASVVDQTGRLVKAGRWWTFLANQPEGIIKRPPPPPIKLLPNAVLEGMVSASANTSNPPQFKLSGEMTVFAGENYLLPRVSTRAMPTHHRQPAVAPAIDVDASTDDVLDVLSAAEDVLDAMPLRADGPTGGALPGVGGAMLLDGSPLVGRPGRPIKSGDWWTFVFESVNADYREPPLKLLPNKNLELMISATRDSPSGIVLIVSGEVTTFQGTNYLLVRAATRRIDTGNLKK